MKKLRYAFIIVLSMMLVFSNQSFKINAVSNANINILENISESVEKNEIERINNIIQHDQISKERDLSLDIDKSDIACYFITFLFLIITICILKKIKIKYN